MRIFLAGDTHGINDIGKLHYFNNHGDGRFLNKNDYVIILGDTAIAWSNEEYENKIRAEYDKFNWTTLFLDGNHVNHSKLINLPTFNFHNGKASRVTDNIIYLRRGEIYTFNNKKFLIIGGALSIDKANRTEGIDYWSTELLSYEEECHVIDNLKKHNYKVDYILTHTIPIDFVKILNDIFKIHDPVARFLQHIYNNTKFKKWFAGHFHVDKQMLNLNILFNDLIEIEEL